MLAVDFQNTNQVNSHVLYSDSWEKKLHWLSTYHTLLPDFQNTNQDNFLFFYLLYKMEGAYRKLIYPITGLNLLLDTMIKKLMIN